MQLPALRSPVLSLWARASVATFAAASLLATTVGRPVLAGDDARVDAARKRAIEFLRATQSTDGSWTTGESAGITGLVTTAALQNGVKPDDPMVQKSLAFLKSFAKPDGGIYSTKGDQRNYETSISLLAFRAANADGRYDKLIADAAKFLRKLQWDDEEGAKPDDIKYGGAGYGRSGDRPDLSNTAFLLDALKAAGATPDDPAMQKALVFVSRCQNLESQNNTTPFASKINDGGFFYTPAAGGSSFAGTEANGGLRSYGSMTYAGLKSMIYAGLTPEDPRVKAAMEWIKSRYTLEENPGMGQGGLYYYYHTFAKTLDSLKSDSMTDSKGKKHEWRKELEEQLLARQASNGSWVNPERRWMEGDPNLTTAYALMTLVYCRPESK